MLQKSGIWRVHDKSLKENNSPPIVWKTNCSLGGPKTAPLSRPLCHFHFLGSGEQQEMENEDVNYSER